MTTVTDTTAEQTALKYVYGVVGADTAAPRRAGIAGAPVTMLVNGDLAALVSDLPGEDLAAGSDELRVHSEVLAEALELGPVLPMRFGVVLADGATVCDELLERFHDELAVQLQELTGKVELHLRAIYDESDLMAEVVRSDPRIARLREELRGHSSDATYYQRIELGQMVSAAVEGIREHDAEAILDELAPLAVATQVDQVEHERVVINACFLVEADGLAQFDGAVDEAGRRRKGQMTFQYNGPLPAYSFVELPG